VDRIDVIADLTSNGRIGAVLRTSGRGSKARLTPLAVREEKNRFRAFAKGYGDKKSDRGREDAFELAWKRRRPRLSRTGTAEPEEVVPGLIDGMIEGFSVSFALRTWGPDSRRKKKRFSRRS